MLIYMTITVLVNNFIIGFKVQYVTILDFTDVKERDNNTKTVNHQ